MKFNRIFMLAGLAAMSVAAVSCKDDVPEEPSANTVAVKSVALDCESMAVETMQFIDLTATVMPEDATNKNLVWSSDNEDVADVEDGTVTTNAPGTATITVTTEDGGFSASCVFTVTIPLKSISLDCKVASVGERETITLNVIYPENATRLPVVWSSSDTSIATVDENGCVSGICPGDAVITAKAGEGKLTATCVVTVKKTNLPWVLSPDGKEYPAGVTVTTFKDALDGDNYCQGAYAHIDFSANPDLRFNVLFGGMKTLVTTGPGDDVDWYDKFPEEDGIPIILTNGGFFDSTYGSSSLVGLSGIIRAAGASTTGLSGYSGDYYPVRSALYTDKNGKFHITWAYPMSDGVYSFPSALDQNDATGTFLPAPPTKNTAGAKKLNFVSIIQGGPRLVQDGQNVAELNTRAELLTGTVGRPHGYRTSRTAIGIKADGSIIMLVCEGDGRNGDTNAGFDVCELADKFIELGCTDAINFDGGGSSEMVGPGCETIARRINLKAQRAMPTALCVSEIRYE